MNIKVQIESFSTSSILNCGLPKEGELLTFIAYSDLMKGKILELICKGQKLWLSFTYEKKDGEWHEEKAENAIFIEGNKT